MQPQSPVERIDEADLDRLGEELLALTDAEFLSRVRGLMQGTSEEHRHNTRLLTLWRGEREGSSGALTHRALAITKDVKKRVEAVFSAPNGTVDQLLTVLVPMGYSYHLDPRVKILLDRESVINQAAAFARLQAGKVKVDPAWLPKNYTAASAD